MPIDPEEEARWSIPRRPWNRLVRAGDREGPLFTTDDLVAALRWGHLYDGYKSFLHTLTDVPADAPDRMWPEDLLILIALVVEERRERIRRALNFSPEALADAFARVRASLPGEGEERLPKPLTSSRSYAERRLPATDEEGELFTRDELSSVLRRRYSEEHAQELLTTIFSDGTSEAPTEGWTEHALVMVAVMIPGRAARIRRHLGLSTEEMEEELERLGRYLA